MEAGATIRIQKRSQDWRSHEDLYYSERLCRPGPSCNGEFADSLHVTLLIITKSGDWQQSLQQCQHLDCILWALVNENIIKCTLLWFVPLWFAYTEGCFGLFSKWVLFWAECDLVFVDCQRADVSSVLFCSVLACIMWSSSPSSCFMCCYFGCHGPLIMLPL